MSSFDVQEECPHCEELQPSRQLDTHVAAAHADLPPCTARIETAYRETYRCAFRAGHEKGKYGCWHASTCGEPTGRHVWNDRAMGATPHVARPEQPMSNPCARPECGGDIHTDPWGAPIQCPHADAADSGRRCPRCDCPDGHTQCEHCKVCPHARQAGATVTTEQQTRPLTTDEQFRMLFDRTAKLNDAVSALLAPEWGARMGIIPEGHPLHPGADEQGVPVDWQAIAEQRERELKKVGEARHRAEQAIARVRDVIAERRTEVAEREEGGILPFGTPGASWCDAVTVTCSRVEEALRAPVEHGGIPAKPDQQIKGNSA